VDKWGKDFFAFPVRTPTGYGNWGGMLGIVANENGTNVTVSGGISGGSRSYNLNAGGKQYICDTMSGLTRIFSDKPIMVFLAPPDATIMNIPATDQRVQHAFVAPFILSGNTNITAHGIDLLIPAAYWNQTVIQHDGIVVSNSLYTVNQSVDFPDWYHVRRNLSNVNVQITIDCPGGFLAYLSGSGASESYGFSSGAAAYDLQSYFTIQEQATTTNTYYKNTNTFTHTFLETDTVAISRTINKVFDTVKWLVNDVPYTVTENTNVINTFKIPASVLNSGENTITMSVRFIGVSVDSLYTGNVWVAIPVGVCSGDNISLHVDTILHGGTTPEFQWFVNGDTVSGARDSIFTYFPTNGDIVLCRMVSQDDCLTSDTVFSSAVKVVIKPNPVFQTPNIMPQTCSEVDFDSPFQVTTNPASSITWTRAWVAGITPATGSGSGNTISEALTNTSSTAVTVTYLITATADGCSTTQTVTRVVQSKLTPAIRIGVRR
jgi:hypothetical protein